MQSRSEFQSSDDLATEQFIRPSVETIDVSKLEAIDDRLSLDAIDATIPAPLYTSPYEQVEVEQDVDVDDVKVTIDHASMSFSASRNLVAPEKTAKRRRAKPPIVEISAMTMILAAVAGAGAFILGVVVASMVL